MIKHTEKTMTTTTSTTTYSVSVLTNIAPDLKHCFSDGDYCWQTDYNNQIHIEKVKGEKISKDISRKDTSFMIECKIDRLFSVKGPHSSII